MISFHLDMYPGVGLLGHMVEKPGQRDFNIADVDVNCKSITILGEQFDIAW